MGDIKRKDEYDTMENVGKMAGINVFGHDLGPMLDDFELKYSLWAYAACIPFYVIALAISFIEGYYRAPNPGFAAQLGIVEVVMVVISIPLSAIASMGFVKLGRIWGSRFLAHSTLFFLAAAVILSILPISSEMMFIMSEKPNMMFDLALYVVSSLFSAASSIVFAAALWTASKDSAVRVAAVGNLIAGLLSATVILAIGGAVLGIFVMFLDAYVLLREVKRAKT
jgi:hypothetical protein